MKLIINADDLGISKGVSDGILYLYNKGVITSTSIFANLPFTPYGIEVYKKANFLDVGLHVNLTVGNSLTKNKKLCPFTCDKLVNVEYKHKLLNTVSYKEAKEEIYEQLNLLTKNGVIISHINAHGGITKYEEIVNAILDVALEESLPTRCFEEEIKIKAREKNLTFADEFYMNFFNKGVKFETLQKIIEDNSNLDKTVEIMTHIGFVDEYLMNFSNYNLNRETELNVLEDFFTNAKFQNVEFITHKDLRL